MADITIPVIGGYLSYLVFILLGISIYGKIKQYQAGSDTKTKMFVIPDIAGFIILIVFLLQYYNYYAFGIANDALLFIVMICFLTSMLPYLFTKGRGY